MLVGKPIVPRVDNRAPMLHVEHVLGTGKLVHDLQRQRTLARENRELLKLINQIYRAQGFLNVDYSYRVHQSLNSKARETVARLVESQNLLLLDRLLARKATVDSNLWRKAKGKTRCPAAVAAAEKAERLRIDFWERTDRWLCRLVVTLCPREVSWGGELTPLATTGQRGKIFRIFRGTCMVLRTGEVSRTEEALEEEFGELFDVPQGSLVKQRQGGREHLLITLRKLANVSGGRMLGRLCPGSMKELELLNYYGTKFGPCREPITYAVVKEGRH